MQRAVKVEENMIMFICPGCESQEHIPVNGRKNSRGAGWSFNGDFVNPTFTPSINSAWGKFADPNWEEPTGEDAGQNWSGRCHSFVINGKIQFLNDCTHKLVGQTVDLPEIPEYVIAYYNKQNNG